MAVDLPLTVKSFTSVYTVRLGLCFKTECSVLYLLYTALEIGTASEKVSDVELNARLIGEYR